MAKKLVPVMELRELIKRANTIKVYVQVTPERGIYVPVQRYAAELLAEEFESHDPVEVDWVSRRLDLKIG